MYKGTLYRLSQNPSPRLGVLDPISEGSFLFLTLSDCTFGDTARLWGGNFPWIRHYPIVSPGKPSTRPSTHLSTSQGFPPSDLPVPGRLPACCGGGGPQGAPESGVPGTEATHVSRRIFLSATTSPVNLFLALYTTPYVPSPIFSTFWKFSMKR